MKLYSLSSVHEDPSYTFFAGALLAVCWLSHNRFRSSMIYVIDCPKANDCFIGKSGSASWLASINNIANNLELV